MVMEISRVFLRLVINYYWPFFRLGFWKTKKMIHYNTYIEIRVKFKQSGMFQVFSELNSLVLTKQIINLKILFKIILIIIFNNLKLGRLDSSTNEFVQYAFLNNCFLRGRHLLNYLVFLENSLRKSILFARSDV